MSTHETMQHNPTGREKLPPLVKKIARSCLALEGITNLSRKPLPSRDECIRFISLMQQMLFPGYFGYPFLGKANIEGQISTLVDQVYDLLWTQIYRGQCHVCEDETCDQETCSQCGRRAEDKLMAFLESVPNIRKSLHLDIRKAYAGDPAAKSFDEIIFSYPGLFAIMVYRVAHELWVLEVPLIPRILSEHAHALTGVDIHPGATIGKSFFIDHGTGVVIGETATIGDNVQIYQGVTLGALAPKDGDQWRGVKRHPTIEDNVTLYSNAAILGGETVVGKGSVINGNVFLTKSVPPGTVVGLEPPQLKFRNQKK